MTRSAAITGYRRSISLIATLLLAFSSFAQPAPQSIADSLQSILDHALPINFSAPGVIMRVEVPGQWTWEGAAGKGISGTTVGQPQTIASSTDHFRTGSVTKMLVATAILMLEEGGSLSIEDPIANYLRPTLVNDTINSSSTVLIRHLLNHTSGIKNSADNSTCQMDVLTNPLNSHTLEEAVYCGASQGEAFVPGTSWLYSNTNYTLLAMIIESVTGMSYRQFIYQTIISPLSLSNTEFPTTDQITGPHMGCYWNIPGLGWTDLTIINSTAYAGWADLVTSTADLITFYKALRNGQLIDAAEWTSMQTIFPFSNYYGLGLDYYVFYSSSYEGHYGEVANTSGLFFGGISSSIAPNGYYISYNFNTQGASMQLKIDKPVMNLLKNGIAGIQENPLAEGISVYPNPASDQLTVTVPDEAGSMIMELLDINGKTILAQTVVVGQMDLNTADLKNGVYLLHIFNDQFNTIERLIIENH